MAAGTGTGIPEDNIKSLWNTFFVLRQQIESVKKENRQLETEWNAKKHQTKQSADVHVYKDLILKKTKDAVVLLNQQKEAELERIRSEFAARKAEQEERARKIDEELQMYQSLLQVMLNELERVVLQIEEDGAQPENGMQAEEPDIAGEEPELQEPYPVYPVDVLLPDLRPQEPPPSPEAPSAEALQFPETINGFWDDIDAYVKEFSESARSDLAGASEAASGMEPKDHLVISAVFPEQAAMDAFPGAMATGPLVAAAADMTGRGNKVVPLKPQASQEKKHAVTPLNEEIDLIKSQYIIGNKAGEDLYDRAGLLIVGKNGIITADVVNKAEAEGKMADLIVQMILPGFGDQDHE